MRWLLWIFLAPLVLAWPSVRDVEKSSHTTFGEVRECYSHGLNRGRVTTTNGWFPGSWALYTCDNIEILPHYKAGYYFLDWTNYRQCIQLPDHYPGWRPKLDGIPRCTDICNYWEYKDAYSQPTLHGQGVSYDVCRERGGCLTKSNACVTTKYPAMVRQSGVKPTSPELSQDKSAPRQCAWRCFYGRDFDYFENPSNCDAFALEDIQVVKEANLTERTCYMTSSSTTLTRDDGTDTFMPIRLQGIDTADAVRTLDKGVHVDCYSADDLNSDFVDMVTGSDTMTTRRCMYTCHLQGYNFAAVKGGRDCACSMAEHVGSWSRGTCSSVCSGDSAAICGGDNAADVYVVPQESALQGCIEKAASTSSHMWDGSAGKTARDCPRDCGRKGFVYALITRGGDCACSNNIGAPVELEKCNSLCKNSANLAYCGSEDGIYASMFITTAAFDVAKLDQVIHPLASILYTNEANGFTSGIFRDLPFFKAFISNRLVFQSYEPIIGIHEMAMTAEAEVAQCGGKIDLSEADSDDVRNIDDVIIRAIVVKWSDIEQYNMPATVKRVFIYAVTFYVDQDIDVKYSLLVRARRVVLDKGKMFHVSVARDSAELGLDMDAIQTSGAPLDHVAMSQHFMCARTLLDEKTPVAQHAAWGILKDLLSAPSTTNAAVALGGRVRSYITAMKGVDRLKVHIVPIYSTKALANLLEVIYGDLMTYNDQYERFKKQINNYEDVLNFGSSMTKIFTHRAITEAEGALNDAMTVIRRNEAVYKGLNKKFRAARDNQWKVSLQFRNAIQKAEYTRMLSAVADIVIGLAKAGKGVYTKDISGAVENVVKVVKAASSIDKSLMSVHEMVVGINKVIYGMDEQMKKIEETHKVPYDGSDFAYDIKNVVNLRVQSVAWENVKIQMDAILNEPTVRAIAGSKDYGKAVLEVCNWGKALTDAMVEVAESLRDVQAKRHTLDIRNDVRERTRTALGSLNRDLSNRHHLLDAISEQTAEVRTEMNEALLMFCQAYFFKTLTQCRRSYRPSYGGTLPELLLKINKARRDHILIKGIPSTTAREIDITDEDKDPDCTDCARCPINCLRKQRRFSFQISSNNPTFADLDHMRVSEFELKVHGAEASGSNRFLKFSIQASGTFEGRAFGKSYTFMMRPINKVFEYNIETGTIMIRADVYEDQKTIVSQVTPFATWQFQVDDRRSHDIDLSKVTKVTLTMRGSSLVLNTPQHYKAEAATNGTAA